MTENSFIDKKSSLYAVVRFRIANSDNNPDVHSKKLDLSLLNLNYDVKSSPFQMKVAFPVELGGH